MPRGTGRVDEAIQQSRLWSPSVLRPSLWMDAADISTLTLDSSSLVTEWRDKSGFDRYATTIGGTITYLPGGWAGLPCLQFAANSARMRIASAPIFASGNANIGLFVVIRPNYTGTSYSSVFANYDIGNFQFLTGINIPYLTPYGLYNNAAVDLSNASYVAGLRQIIATTRTDSYFTGFQNGYEQNTVANTQSVYAGSGTQSVWAINSNASVSGNVESNAQDYCEIIAINANVPYDDRTAIEGYLAWKWGLVDTLNPAHPYALRPPLIGD
jgi:hypothetical protein